MKSSKLIDLFKNGNIVIPMYLLQKYKDFQLDLEEFIILMYLYNKGNHYVFDPNSFGNELNMELNDIMRIFDNLSSKGFVSIQVEKNDKGFMEEIVSLDDFYHKIKDVLVDDVNRDQEKKSLESNVYKSIEKEFGRLLTPYESEIIGTWLKGDYSEEIIQEAVKEATFNGVSNLKYIDRILYDWDNKGIKTIEQVEENRRKREKAIAKNKDNDSDIDMEIMDWDWFDEEE